MNFIDWCREFIYKQPATSLGLLLGVLLGLSFAAFGFWRTFVVGLCIAVGLYIGVKVDAGQGPDFQAIKERWQNRHKKQGGQGF